MIRIEFAGHHGHFAYGGRQFYIIAHAIGNRAIWSLYDWPEGDLLERFANEETLTSSSAQRFLARDDVQLTLVGETL